MSEKTKKIAYWFFTLWLSLGMVSTAIVQLMKLPEEVEKINQLGYPTYFLTLLGVWKILGVIAVLAPKFLLLKEWAYAGFFFAMSGAAYSHIVMGNPMSETLPSVLLLALTIISWYLRPKQRKMF
ncbi:DoxX family protein [Leptospira sp. 201903074]|uniref:DoxX family protein n=1 Tax=Leptospira abararensis TaxID=2810036 RepID=UPI0019636576|nr:DoxX family protein [Leptospira abararensis]MBM9547556.1 DoxX family protein [Leptospira abararensis]